MALEMIALGACTAGGLGVGTPSLPPEAAASPTTDATAVPTPEPAPGLAFFGESAYLDSQIIGAWAADHRWTFAEAPIETLDQWIGRPELHAVILSVPGISPQQLDAIPAGVHVIILGNADFEAGGRVSTVGEPGARRDQLGFVAGMMVGMATYSHSVGLLGGTAGEHEPVYRMGFIHGLRFACPRCGLVEDQASISNPGALQEARVDALLVLPGPGAAEAAERMMASGIWVVWADIVPVGMSQDRLAGWVHFDASPLVIQALQGFLSGQGGGAYPYSAGTGGIVFQVLQSEAISPGRLGFIQRAWEQMQDGDLDTGVDPLTGAER
jgi:hypothetical protein